MAWQAIAETIAKSCREEGRAAAYALAAHVVEVLAQNEAERALRNTPAGPEPITFLRGVVVMLVIQVTQPALLRDIAALLERRLPSDTVSERALLEAGARRWESPDFFATLERLDPDMAVWLQRLRGISPKPASKPPPRRGKRGSVSRRTRK
jgi:hypothetical protein